jgi:hypothetical protein
MDRAGKEEMRGARTHTRAFRTSFREITPSFSPGNASFAEEKRWNASLISVSCSALMSFSLASLDWRVRGFLGVAAEGGPPRFFGGCSHIISFIGISISGRMPSLPLLG